MIHGDRFLGSVKKALTNPITGFTKSLKIPVKYPGETFLRYIGIILLEIFKENL